MAKSRYNCITKLLQQSAKRVRLLKSNVVGVMKIESKILRRFGGISIIVLFSIWILLSEWGSMIIGDDLGAFLYTTIHFIINPILGVAAILCVIWHCFKTEELIIRILNICACAVPTFIIFIGLTGNPWLSEALGIKFQ